MSVDCNEAAATPAGTARRPKPRTEAKPREKARAVPAESVGRVMEINAISQERAKNLEK